MREITTFTLLYNGEEGKQQDRIVKQFDRSHTVNLMVWMKLRMKFLSCYRKYAAWLISALRRIREWQMLQQPSEIGVWESRAGSVGYLRRKQNWNDKISESCRYNRDSGRAFVKSLQSISTLWVCQQIWDKWKLSACFHLDFPNILNRTQARV